MAWNAITPYVQVSQAPGSLNWCIGCVGSIVSASNPGIYDSQNLLVSPDSLYLQQLRERLGDQALVAINAQPFGISSSPTTRSTPAGSPASFTVAYAPRVFTLTGSGSNGVSPGQAVQRFDQFFDHRPARGSQRQLQPVVAIGGWQHHGERDHHRPPTVPGDYPLDDQGLEPALRHQQRRHPDRHAAAAHLHTVGGACQPDRGAWQPAPPTP